MPERLPRKPGIYRISTPYGHYRGQSFSIAYRIDSHLEAARVETNSNHVLAQSLVDGDYTSIVIETVEKQLPSRRHLRSFLLGREAYWMDQTGECINLAKPERPILALTRIQSDRRLLGVDLDQEIAERDKTRGFVWRSIKQQVDKTGTRLNELEEA